jgi:hypothetical protein
MTSPRLVTQGRPDRGFRFPRARQNGRGRGRACTRGPFGEVTQIPCRQRDGGCQSVFQEWEVIRGRRIVGSSPWRNSHPEYMAADRRQDQGDRCGWKAAAWMQKYLTALLFGLFIEDRLDRA